MAELKKFYFAVEVKCQEYTPEGAKEYFGEDYVFNADMPSNWIARHILLSMIKGASDYELLRSGQVLLDNNVMGPNLLKDEEKEDFESYVKRAAFYKTISDSLIDLEKEEEQK